MRSPAIIVDLDIPPAPKPIITPVLVTIAEVAPKLTVGSVKAIICLQPSTPILVQLASDDVLDSDYE